jgi:HK97 family phage major capsid protein
MKRSLFAILAVCAVALFSVGAAAVPLDATHLSLAQGLTDSGLWIGLGSVTGAGLRALQERKGAEITAMRALQDKATGENRVLTDEEQKTFDGHAAKAKDLNAAIEREQLLMAEEAGMKPVAGAAAAAGGSVVNLPATARIIGTDHNADKDPKRGFSHLGEYARSVRHAALVGRTGGAIDERLNALGGMQAAAPTTFGSEASGSDGGFLIPTGFSNNIWTLSLEEDALLARTDRLPVEGNSMSLPKDETTPWGSNGIRAYWQGEAQAATPTKPVIGRAEMKLKKLMALVPMSDELMADAVALGAYLQPNMARSIRWKSDEAILFGGGNGQPLGMFHAQSPSFVMVSKEAGQATMTLDPKNLAKMIARLMPGSYGRAIWLINNDVLPALFTMTLGNYPIYLPAGAPVGGIQGSPYGSLLGRPIVVTQHAKSFSSQGDVMLVDFSWYQTIEKAGGGIETATSMHLYFDADSVAFRATFRVDGQPKLAAPITPANGSNTLSPAIVLEAR